MLLTPKWVRLEGFTAAVVATTTYWLQLRQTGTLDALGTGRCGVAGGFVVGAL